MDMALKGKVAIVEAIERDFEDHVHLAVVLEDDPAVILECYGSPDTVFSFRRKKWNRWR